MNGLGSALDESALRKLARSQGFKVERRRRTNSNDWGEPARYRIVTSGGEYIGGDGWSSYQLTLDEVRQFLTVPAVPAIQLERIKLEILKQLRAEDAEFVSKARKRGEAEARSHLRPISPAVADIMRNAQNPDDAPSH